MCTARFNSRRRMLRLAFRAAPAAAIAALIAGCPTGTPATPTWQLPLRNLPAGLLSISGTAADNVIAVGADPGDGGGPLVLNYDGQSWRRLNTGASDDLWWISDRAIDGAFYMGGEGGLILRFDLASKSFERFATPGNQTIFGVWGENSGNVFAVGGSVDEPDTSGVIWRFDGSNWRVEDLSSIEPAGFPVAFKVWGQSENAIYVCGARGLILEFDGTAWRRLDSTTTRTLFTVHGNESLVVASGGAQSGVLVERSAAAFANVTPSGLLQMNGVFVPSTGNAVAVGLEGAVAFRADGAWQAQETGLDLDSLVDYHAAWVDPDGGVWAVGGNIAGEPRTDGVVAYYGRATIGSALE
ncbi:MAG: hypothetical protein HRF50_09990 [Phycisphaerae bacterium]